MPAFPSAVKSFTTQVDWIDLCDETDMNELFDEIVAVEEYLGLNPHVVPALASRFDSTTGKNWGSVANRVANIEAGLGMVQGNQFTGGLFAFQVGSQTVTFTSPVSSNGSVQQVTVNLANGRFTQPPVITCFFEDSHLVFPLMVVNLGTVTTTSFTVWIYHNSPPSSGTTSGLLNFYAVQYTSDSASG